MNKLLDAIYVAACIVGGCVILTLSADLHAKTADVLTKDEKNAIKKRYATRREVITIDTQKYWVVDYAVGGKHVETKTNKVVSVFGVRQENPLEADAKKAQKIEKAARKAKKKDQNTWDGMIKDLEKARDKFIDAEFKDLTQQVLDMLNQSVEPGAK